MSGSCVTITIVIPRSLSFWKMPMISTTGAAVEVAGRLIGEHDFRIVDQGTRDRDALLLAAGKLAGMMIFAAVKGRR